MADEDRTTGKGANENSKTSEEGTDQSGATNATSSQESNDQNHTGKHEAGSTTESPGQRDSGRVRGKGTDADLKRKRATKKDETVNNSAAAWFTLG